MSDTQAANAPDPIIRFVQDLTNRHHGLEGTLLLRIDGEPPYRLVFTGDGCRIDHQPGPATVGMHLATAEQLEPLLRGSLPLWVEPPLGPLAVDGDTTFFHALIRERMLGADAGLAGLALPALLICDDGSRVDDDAAWRAKRRPEVLALFERHLYGRAPGQPESLSWECIEADDAALDGRAVRRQVLLHVRNKGRELPLELLIYLPKAASSPVPLFLGLNFGGNHTVHPDPAIRITRQWIRDTHGGEPHTADEETRGSAAGRWCLERILARGFGLATLYCGDLDPDYDDGFQNGVHPLFYGPNQSRPAADEWGAISAWAWGLSRVMDYLEEDGAIDARHVAMMGHSRLGKTALWAGAQDERFALVISNCSGCCGAALSRRRFGETLERLDGIFPHWCCQNAHDYDGRESALPVDQHMLLALIAPRPLYVASAYEDTWADPKGEFLSALAASPVYELLGAQGLPTREMPAPGRSVVSGIGYHVRPGGHDVTDYDWDQYMAFAERHWNGEV